MLLIAVAIGFAFGRVFQGRSTTVLLLAAGALSALVAVAFERRGVTLTVLVGLAILVVGITLLFFRDTTWYGLPTLETLRAAGETAAEVGEQARIQISPAPPIAPLVLASLLAVWAAVFSTHALAFRAGSPILALVPPLALIAFADSVLEEFEKPIYGILFLVAGLAVLFADGLRRVQGWGPVWNGPGRRDRLLPTAGFQARRLTAGVIAVAVVAPFVVPGFGSKGVIELDDIGRPAGSGVSILVSMAATLRGGEARNLFDVEAPVPSYYRLTALEEFDGVEWSHGDSDVREVESGSTFMVPPTDAEPFTQRFTLLDDYADVGGLETYLPVGYAPTSVEAEGDLTWEVDTQSVRVSGGLEEGDEFLAQSTYLTPDPDALRRTEVVPGLDPTLTELPAGLPTGIRDIAVEWTAGVETDFDAIMAIEDRLTSGSFRYSTDVTPREDSGSILEFLTTERRGFCQQFATAMAVMLRSLGIPARVAVGFTQGQDRPGDTFRISTKNYHAWVEVPFAGYGWLAFEPTPSRENPTAASYLNPETDDPGCPSGRPCPSASPRPSPSVSADVPCDVRGVEGGCTATPTAAPGAGTALPGQTPWALLGVVAALLLVVLGFLAVPFARWLRRRRTLRRAGSSPRRLILANYDVLSQRAAVAGLARRPDETPAEWERRLLASGRVDAEDLERLTRLAVRAAYAPDEPSPDDALDAAADAQQVSKVLQRSVPMPERVRATYRRR
jgi:transglutaminase-like putative cysteine protease